MSRFLEDSPSVLLIVYTPGDGATERGYEPWLVDIDNPFFNAIPGVHHYANWRLDKVLRGDPPYTHFDFQGLVAASDLERVWFNPDLDGFRKEWIKLWGYGTGSRTPSVMQGHAYLMTPVGRGKPRGDHATALLVGGLGDAPDGLDAVWRVEQVVAKHFATGGDTARWHWPVAEGNPLGLDWVGIRYGDDATVPEGATLAAVIGLIASPDQGSAAA